MIIDLKGDLYKAGALPSSAVKCLFYDFTDLAAKCLFGPIMGSFLERILTLKIEKLLF